jgi:hypothetical protein
MVSMRLIIQDYELVGLFPVLYYVHCGLTFPSESLHNECSSGQSVYTPMRHIDHEAVCQGSAPAVVNNRSLSSREMECCSSRCCGFYDNIRVHCFGIYELNRN